jgi:hypothetical protein
MSDRNNTRNRKVERLTKTKPKKAKRRSNARPEISSEWVPATPGKSRTFALINPTTGLPESMTPHLSTKPRSKTHGAPIPVDTLKYELVPDGEPLDLNEVLDLVHGVMFMAFEILIGLGEGAVLERSRFRDMCTLMQTINQKRQDAKMVTRQQQALDQLAAIYQATSDVWSSAENDSHAFEARRRERAVRDAVEKQRVALREFAVRFNFDESFASKAEQDGKVIADAGGAVKIASTMLAKFNMGSASKLQKDRGRVTPLFETIAMREVFPTDKYNEETEREFGRLAQALYAAKAITSETMPRGAFTEEQRAMLRKQITLILGTRFYGQRWVNFLIGQNHP